MHLVDEAWRGVDRFAVPREVDRFAATPIVASRRHCGINSEDEQGNIITRGAAEAVSERRLRRMRLQFGPRVHCRRGVMLQAAPSAPRCLGSTIFSVNQLG